MLPEDHDAFRRTVRAFPEREVLPHYERREREGAVDREAWRTADRCPQLHGGYDCMSEYPVARAFTGGRVQTVYGGTTEIMKESIGRSPLS
ncbi:acyl-CoA dehydrogenase family protein [Streptomyces sp. CNQ085]|nr:acyl-CoA dehydrogenase family protein [Streptomyces sp. CNQ085]